MCYYDSVCVCVCACDDGWRRHERNTLSRNEKTRARKKSDRIGNVFSRDGNTHGARKTTTRDSRRVKYYPDGRQSGAYLCTVCSTALNTYYRNILISSRLIKR